jgi:hypothetical protein
VPDPTGPRSGRIGGPRRDPEAPASGPGSGPGPEAGPGPRAPWEPGGGGEGASEQEARDAPGHASARAVDAMFEQLGEAAPAVLEHVVNAARELMRAAKAVVDAAEGAMESARGTDAAGTEPSPAAGTDASGSDGAASADGAAPHDRAAPAGRPGAPKAKRTQRIDVD